MGRSTWDVAQLVRAPVLYTGGHGFKSHRPNNQGKPLVISLLFFNLRLILKSLPRNGEEAYALVAQMDRATHF